MMTHCCSPNHPRWVANSDAVPAHWLLSSRATAHTLNVSPAASPAGVQVTWRNLPHGPVSHATSLTDPLVTAHEFQLKLYLGDLALGASIGLFSRALFEATGLF
jgi:hypothetical protein